MPVADGEAVDAVVGLGPPAVEDRQIEPAVEQHLLAAGAAGLLRAARVVQPDVDALHQVAADVDVVVLDEHDPLPRARGVSAFVARPCCISSLPGLVGGCALPAKTSCTGRCGVVEQLGAAASRSRKIRFGALVGGEAAGEADGQRVGIERVSAAATRSSP